MGGTFAYKQDDIGVHKRELAFKGGYALRAIVS